MPPVLAQPKPARPDEQLILRFDALLPVGQRMFANADLAIALDVHDDTINRAFLQPDPLRRLLGLGLNAGPGGGKLLKRYPRAEACLWIARHANYDFATLRDLLDDLVRNLPTNALDHLNTAADVELRLRH